MHIDVKCFATLVAYSPEGGSMEFSPPLTLAELLDILGVPVQEVRLVFVNGKNVSDWSGRVENGDRIGIFPPVGGG